MTQRCSTSTRASSSPTKRRWATRQPDERPMLGVPGVMPAATAFRWRPSSKLRSARPPLPANQHNADDMPSAVTGHSPRAWTHRGTGRAHSRTQDVNRRQVVEPAPAGSSGGQKNGDLPLAGCLTARRDDQRRDGGGDPRCGAGPPARPAHPADSREDPRARQGPRPRDRPPGLRREGEDARRRRSSPVSSAR